jgi:acetyltransferase-like isoleucine patch superfamily enzyme
VATRIERLLAQQAEKLRLRWAYRLGGIDGVVRYLQAAPSDFIVPALRRHGAAIGHGTYAKGPLHLDNAYTDLNSAGDFRHLTAGRDCYLGKNVTLDLAAPILLGDEVILAAGALVLTHQDCGARRMAAYYARRTASVTIGDGAWIGAGAVILAGARIGECAVVGAGAVVLRDVPPFTVVGGVPAVVLRSLDPAQIRREEPSEWLPR